MTLPRRWRYDTTALRSFRSKATVIRGFKPYLILIQYSRSCVSIRKTWCSKQINVSHIIEMTVFKKTKKLGIYLWLHQNSKCFSSLLGQCFPPTEDSIDSQSAIPVYCLFPEWSRPWLSTEIVLCLTLQMFRILNPVVQ